MHPSTNPTLDRTIAAPQPLGLLDIARREEARLMQVMRETADETRPFLGGLMARSSPGTWANYAVGFGFPHAPPTDSAAPPTAHPDDDPDHLKAEVAGLIDYYASKGIEPRLEAHPFVRQPVLAALEAAKFSVRQFEIVFYRDLALTPGLIAAPSPAPRGLHIREVDKRDDADVRSYAHLAMSGFYPPGTSPTEADIALVLKACRAPRTLSFLATIDGQPAGAGGMETHDDVATLFGLSVAPEFRRRGIQQALIAYRLEHARAKGSRLATIGSLPGSPTERNVRRMGFDVAYVKAILVRPGEGLARIIT